LICGGLNVVFFRYVLGVLLVLSAYAGFAQATGNAPVNLAPNSQWEVMSGWSFGTQENYQGTGTVGAIVASANTTGAIGRATFFVTTTDELNVGDLVFVTGTPADGCFNISPMRIVAMVMNTSITVRTPLGCKPATSGSTTIIPVTAGNTAITSTGSGPDGWLKTPSLPMWRNENRGGYAANMPTDTGAYAALGMTKDSASAEHFAIHVPSQTLARFEGRTVVLGIYGYQKIRGGSGTWTIWTNDSVNGARTPCANATTASGYQWLECRFTVPPTTTYFYAGVQLNGAASDTYYFVDPVLAIGNTVGGVKNYQKPQGEILIPQVHISPVGWINATLTFPPSAASFCGVLVTCFEHDLYAETGGLIAPTVAKCHGQMEGMDPGAVVTASAYVRVMAWFDRAAAPEKSGGFLPQYVANVKSFSYMDFPLDQTDATPDLLGTGIYASGVASDRWTNVSEEIDWCVLN
jgi:hypothetical protein